MASPATKKNTRTHRLRALLLAGTLAMSLVGCVDGGNDWGGYESRRCAPVRGDRSGLSGSDPFILVVFGSVLLIQAIWSACTRE